MSKVFTRSGKFTTADILAGVQGTKTGYTLKSITALNPPTGVASASGIAPNISLNMSKIGSFTATLTLEHATKTDATITGAQFEITKTAAPTLTFTKRIKTFARGGKFTTADILAGVQGTKTGYTLKSITAVNPTGVAIASGTAPNISLNMSKIGSFTATLTLQHNSKADVTITGAQFELTAKTVENLTFTKRTKAFATGGKFTTAEILAGVQGNKTGYTVKNITNLNPNNLVTVSSKALNFKNVAGTFTATIILQHSTKADVTITNCQFEITKANAETLIFTKITEKFTSGGTIDKAKIMSHITGNKTGYTIKSINALTPTGVASARGTAPNIYLSMTKVGTFNATITLQHSTKQDVVITNCAFELTAKTVENLTFNKITKAFSTGGKFTTAEILAGVQGNKTGYTIKNIAVSKDIVTVSPAKTLDFKNVAGTFTATIILQHSTKADVTITNCEFEITKTAAPTLTWTKQDKAFASRGEITNANLLSGLTGADADKRGYAIKSVRITDKAGTGATVDGAGTSAKIKNYTKIGTLTLTLVFENPTKADVTIADCEFEITKGTAPALTWTKQAKPFASSGEITNANLLSGLTGTTADKQGYAIKSVEITDADGTDARVDGSGTSAKITSYTKIGTLTLTLVFEHSTKKDVTLTGKLFEITKATAPALTWTKQTKVFARGGEITNADILSGLTGAGKAGYQIKTVTITDAAGTGARVNGSGTSAKITSYTKPGTLTLTIVFEHNTKADVTIPNCEFDITKLPAPTLTWTKQEKAFATGGSFTTDEILAGVQGTKDDYTVKEIASLSADIVTLTPAKKALNFKNVAGTFTATIILEHPTKQNVVFTKAQFEITKNPAPTPKLTWTKQEKAFSSSGEITNANLLDGLTGAGKAGYQIKTVNITNDASTGARVNGSGTSAKITNYTKAGMLTLSLVFEHNTKADVNLTGAHFSIKGPAESLTFQKVYKAFANNGSFTTADILRGVQGTKTGYTIKSISTVSPNDVANVTGTAPAISINMSKIGVFTATIVLEHNAKADVTISDAAFQIYSDKLQVSNDGKVTLKSAVDKTTITSMVIPAKIDNIEVKAIGEGAFKLCTKLTTVTIPNSVKSIGNSAFEFCGRLTSVTIPNSVTSIGDYAFKLCMTLTRFTMPNSVESIGSGAFDGCNDLTRITIPNTIKSIERNTFRSCGLSSITIPSTVTSIENGAFQANRSLSSITIPNSVVLIGDTTFYGCISLTSVTIGNSVIIIGSASFFNCTSLTSVTIGNSVRTIENNCFDGCTSLTSITIPNSVMSIGDDIFDGCSSLTDIYVPTGKKIGWESLLTSGNSATVHER